MLQARLEHSLYQYLVSNLLCKSNSNRHQSCTNNNPSDNLASHVRPGGPPNPPPDNSGTCHNIHTCTTGQSDAKINDINLKLSHGLADKWSGGCDRTEAFYKLLHVIKPHSVLLGGVLEVGAPESFNLYV